MIKKIITRGKLETYRNEGELRKLETKTFKLYGDVLQRVLNKGKLDEIIDDNNVYHIECDIYDGINKVLTKNVIFAHQLSSEHPTDVFCTGNKVDLEFVLSDKMIKNPIIQEQIRNTYFDDNSYIKYDEIIKMENKQN